MSVASVKGARIASGRCHTVPGFSNRMLDVTVALMNAK